MKTKYSTNFKTDIWRFAVLVFFAFFSTISWGQIAAWQFGTPATIGDEEIAPATMYHPKIAQPVITRGDGIQAHNLARGFSAINWMLPGVDDNFNSAVSGGNYYEFIIKSERHYKLAISSISARLRRSANGPRRFQWAYKINNIGSFIPIGSTYKTLENAVEEGELITVNTASIADLQAKYETDKNPLIIRLYAWYALEETGTFGFGRTPVGTSTNSLEVNGTIVAEPTIPQASTVSVADVRSTSATVYGSITDAGCPEAPHHGFYWATHSKPSINDNKADFGIAHSSDELVYTMENLTPNTKYYVQTYALNESGTGPGQVLSFTTKPATASNNIAISFTGSGSVTSVDNVLVENLTTGQSKLIDGSAVLYLNSAGDGSIYTSMLDIEGDALSVMSVYPNPATASSTLSFGMAKAGTALMSICDISGKIVSTFSDYLTAGNYKFQLPALRSGVYFVTLAQNGKTKTQKLVSINNGIPEFTQLHQIEKTEHIAAANKPLKVGAATTSAVGMVFNEGNQLRFTATSGRCKTIYLDSPVKSKVQDIRFIECIDGDDNAYPIIKIGQMYWMAENLKTTRKTNGTALAKLTGAAWSGLTPTSDAYCYYADDDANATKFGALYTHHAAKTELAPQGGWRLPTKKEFLQMAGYLDGRERAGARLKETGSNNWNTDNIYATNASGFNAKGSGMKVGTAFSASKTTAAYWISDETSSTDASFAKLTSQHDSISLYADTLKAAGLSVRYVYEVPDVRPEIMGTEFKFLTDNIVEEKGLPLPANTVLMAPDKELFFTGRHDTSLSPQLRFMDNPAATSAPYITGMPAIAAGAVKWWENPKKVTTMVNGNGRESTVMAVWNEAEAGATSGYKNITLHIIGDASENYAQKTFVLPDKFWMPAIVSGATGIAYNGKSMNDYEVQECWQWEMLLRTGDVTGDGIPEILMAVHDTLRIYEYNGTTLKRLYQRGFYSDFNQSKDFAFYLRAEVADMDQDGKNDVVVMTSTPKSYALSASDDSKCAKLHLFLKGNIEIVDAAVYKKKALSNNFNNSSDNAKLVNFAVGDINNDGIPEIALNWSEPGYFVGNSTDIGVGFSFLTYVLYNKSDNINPFKFIDKRYVNGYYNWFVPQPVVLAKLKGPSGPTYIIRGDQIFYIDASGLVQHNGYEEVPSGESVVPYWYITKESTKLNPVFGDQILVGNFDKDPSGREMLYYFVNVKTNAENPTSATLKIYSSALNQTTGEVILNTNPVPFFTENSGNLLSKKHFPVMAAVNTKHTGRVLQFVRHEYTLTKPKLIAALAAPPYYEGYYDTYFSPTSSWGKSTSEGSAKDTIATHTAKAIVGYEHEFELPILGTKIGGIEFTAKAELSFSKNYSGSETTTVTEVYTGGKNDVAVVASTPYDAFFYKIVKSENPLEINTEVMFGFPRQLVTQAIPVETYNKLVEGQNAPRIDRTVFRHTPGNPFSYPYASEPENIRLSNLPWTISGECETAFRGVGVRTESSLTISKESISSTSKSFNQSYDFELVGTVGGFKAGGGYGYSKEKAETTTLGNGNQVEGKVPGLLSSSSNTYQWALKWYIFQKSGYKFQVLNYLVK